MLRAPQTRSGPCVFGGRSSNRTVVLFGDSKAMHLFGAVNGLAHRRGWRLIALTKAGCPAFDVPVYNGKVGRVYRECRRWQRHSLRRIESRARPAIIFTSGSVRHRPVVNGRTISSGPRRRALLSEGYERMLERLAGTGARVLTLKDLPRGPRDMTNCVAENLDDLGQCAFDRDSADPNQFDVRAAEAVAGVEIVDLSPALCSDDTCYGVIRNALVYRDNDHLTATFARTLAPWLARELDRGSG